MDSTELEKQIRRLETLLERFIEAMGYEVTYKYGEHPEVKKKEDSNE